MSNCRWIIETGYANMHYIDYYSFSETGNQLKQTGLLRPVNSRDMKFHRFVFKPDLSTGDDTTIYMKFKNEGAMTISLSIRSEESFFHKSLEEHIIWGVFYGIILIMIFYNLFLYVTLGDNAYIFYVTALFFALLQHLSYNGIGPLYLWSDNILLTRIGIPLFDNCILIFILLFGSSFLELPEKFPRLQFLFKSVIFISIGLICVSPFMPYIYLIRLTLLMMIPNFILSIYAGVASYIKGYSPAGYYLTGWVFLLFGIVILILNHFGILPSNFFTSHTFEFGAVWLLLCGALGLSDRINILKAETDEANTALRMERDKLQALIDGLADMDIGVAIISEKHKIIYQNSTLTKWFGEISEFTCYETFFKKSDPCGNCSAKRALVSGETKRTEIKIDDDRIFEIISTPLGVPTSSEDVVIEVVIDITERKRNQEILAQTEKMMTLGGMAAGIAHEINNPLAGIMQNQQVIFNRFLPDKQKNKNIAEECGLNIEGINAYIEKREIKKMMDLITESGERATQVVKNMLSFSRQEEGATEKIDLRNLLDRTIELAINDYNLKKGFEFRDITIIREYDPILKSVMCQPGKIQQVLLNLLINGAQAMAENNIHEPCFILRINPDEEMVRIDIENNGPAMPEDVRQRVFEPFFTTKDKGKGTGLGLSVSYFIITENHKGLMSVDSNPDVGTRFIIKLPYNL